MCQQYKTEASMTKHNILFIGLDTHKTFTEVAYIEDNNNPATHNNYEARIKNLLSFLGYLNID